MKGFSDKRKIVALAIDEISKVDHDRLINYIAYSDQSEELIRYLTGDKIPLSHYAEIEGRECQSIKTNLHKVLVENRVEYFYFEDEYERYYIKPSDFTSSDDLVELFNSKEKPDHKLKSEGEYLCPIEIPKKIKKKGTCSYSEWRQNTLNNKGTFWMLSR